MRNFPDLQRAACALGAVGVLLCWTGAYAFDTSMREQEIAQCLPGEVRTWGDGRDQPAVSTPLVFAYNHAGAPAWFAQPLVMASLNRAVVAWSGCAVPARVVLWGEGVEPPAGAIRVVWSETASRGNFGLANLTERTLALGPTAFALLQTRNPAYDSSQTLQMVISHEMGHLFGVMAHSRRCVDVTSYYTNGKGDSCFTRDGSPMRKGVEYRSVLPTACDIQRCRAANGQPVLP